MFARILCHSCLLVVMACGAARLPLVSPQEPRERLLLQPEFRLGAFDFGKTTEGQQSVSNAVPAMLLTELRNSGRFAIYEGGNLRSGGPLNETTAHEYVDGYLSGTITSIDEAEACVDLRLSNALTHEVLYARSLCIARAGKKDVDRDAIRRIAEEMARAVKQVANGMVTSADGRVVFCDKGQQAGVSRGMVAYIVGTGDTVVDPAIHQEVRRYATSDLLQQEALAAPIIIGEMYVVSVERNYSIGILSKGSYVLPGDTVFFK